MTTSEMVDVIKQYKEGCMSLSEFITLLRDYPPSMLDNSNMISFIAK